jgi:hypothetical protein
MRCAMAATLPLSSPPPSRDLDWSLYPNIILLSPKDTPRRSLLRKRSRNWTTKSRGGRIGRARLGSTLMTGIIFPVLLARLKSRVSRSATSGGYRWVRRLRPRQVRSKAYKRALEVTLFSNPVSHVRSLESDVSCNPVVCARARSRSSVAE